MGQLDLKFYLPKKSYSSLYIFSLNINLFVQYIKMLLIIRPTSFQLSTTPVATSTLFWRHPSRLAAKVTPCWNTPWSTGQELARDPSSRSTFISYHSSRNTSDQPVQRTATAFGLTKKIKSDFLSINLGVYAGIFWMMTNFSG